MADKDTNKPRGLDLGLSALIERKTDSAPPPAEPDPEPDARPAAASESEFRVLFREGKLRELVERCESSLSAEGESDPEARLWWVKAQLKLGGMPAGIIAAPLESVSRRMVESGAALPDATKTLAAEILIESARRLTDAGDFALAGTFFDRAEALGRRCRDDRRRLAETAVKAIEALPRIPRDRQAEYDRFKQLLASSPAAAPKEESTGFPTPFDAAGFDTGKVEEGVGFGKLARIGGVLVLILAAAGAAIYAEVPIPWFGNRALSEGSAKYEAPPPQLVQAKPERVPGLEHLDAIYYELDGKKKQTADSKPSAPAAPSAAARTVRTDGPIEPESVRQARLRPEEASPASQNDPYRTDPRKIMSAGPGGNSSVQAGPPIRMFEATIPTEVLAEPAFNSQKVAELKQGDRILVEGKDGNFYRIRSRRGRTAYVVTQDVEEVMN